MAYLLLDDGFATHEKIAALSPVAFKFHVTGLCHCARNLTDGHVNNRAVKVIAAIVDVRPAKPIAELVTAGVWFAAPDGDGYVIHDYLDHNPSASKVKADREEAKERMRRLRSRPRSGERSGEQTGERTGARSGVRSVTGGTQPPPIPSHEELGLSPMVDVTRENGHGLESAHPYFALLHAACGATDEALTKLRRAARGKPEAALVIALESCQGPGVRDPLAVALAELGKAGRR